MTNKWEDDWGGGAAPAIDRATEAGQQTTCTVKQQNLDKKSISEYLLK